MADYYRAPTLVLLLILVVVFVFLYARSRTPRLLFWLLGWSLASAHLALQMFMAQNGHDPLLLFGAETTGHAWLHSHCSSDWSAARHAEAIAALAATAIAAPTGFPNDFDKNGGA